MQDRLLLATLPTPLHPLERLSETLGAEVWVKRDDRDHGWQHWRKRDAPAERLRVLHHPVLNRAQGCAFSMAHPLLLGATVFGLGVGRLRRR